MNQEQPPEISAQERRKAIREKLENSLKEADSNGTSEPKTIEVGVSEPDAMDRLGQLLDEALVVPETGLSAETHSAQTEGSGRAQRVSRGQLRDAIRGIGETVVINDNRQQLETNVADTGADVEAPVAVSRNRRSSVRDRARTPAAGDGNVAVGRSDQQGGVSPEAPVLNVVSVGRERSRVTGTATPEEALVASQVGDIEVFIKDDKTSRFSEGQKKWILRTAAFGAGAVAGYVTADRLDASGKSGYSALKTGMTAAAGLGSVVALSRAHMLNRGGRVAEVAERIENTSQAIRTKWIDVVKKDKYGIIGSFLAGFTSGVAVETVVDSLQSTGELPLGHQPEVASHVDPSPGLTDMELNMDEARADSESNGLVVGDIQQTSDGKEFYTTQSESGGLKIYLDTDGDHFPDTVVTNVDGEKVWQLNQEGHLVQVEGVVLPEEVQTAIDNTSTTPALTNAMPPHPEDLQQGSQSTDASWDSVLPDGATTETYGNTGVEWYHSDDGFTYIDTDAVDGPEYRFTPGNTSSLEVYDGSNWKSADIDSINDITRAAINGIDLEYGLQNPDDQVTSMQLISAFDSDGDGKVDPDSGIRIDGEHVYVTIDGKEYPVFYSEDDKTGATGGFEAVNPNGKESWVWDPDTKSWTHLETYNLDSDAAPEIYKSTTGELVADLNNDDELKETIKDFDEKTLTATANDGKTYQYDTTNNEWVEVQPGASTELNVVTHISTQAEISEYYNGKNGTEDILSPSGNDVGDIDFDKGTVRFENGGSVYSLAQHVGKAGDAGWFGGFINANYDELSQSNPDLAREVFDKLNDADGFNWTTDTLSDGRTLREGMMELMGTVSTDTDYQLPVAAHTPSPDWLDGVWGADVTPNTQAPEPVAPNPDEELIYTDKDDVEIRQDETFDKQVAVDRNELYGDPKYNGEETYAYSPESLRGAGTDGYIATDPIGLSVDGGETWSLHYDDAQNAWLADINNDGNALETVNVTVDSGSGNNNWHFTVTNLEDNTIQYNLNPDGTWTTETLEVDIDSNTAELIQGQSVNTIAEYLVNQEGLSYQDAMTKLFEVNEDYWTSASNPNHDIAKGVSVALDNPDGYDFRNNITYQSGDNSLSINLWQAMMRAMHTVPTNVKLKLP